MTKRSKQRKQSTLKTPKNGKQEIDIIRLTMQMPMQQSGQSTAH